MAHYDIDEIAFDLGAARFGVVAARFNGKIVDALLDGALDALRSRGVTDDAISTARVPGAYEVPLAARWLIEHDGVDAVVALGAVIRGDTPHFDYVCAEAARGVTWVAQDCKRPVTFGVLTTDNEAQAWERAGGTHGHAGREAALAAMEMVSLRRALTAHAAS